MIPVFDEGILDDRERIAAADTQGLLRASAAAGAQVRATADAADELAGEPWPGFRPRAMVLAGRPGPGAAATDVLVALLADSVRIPVVCSEVVPAWAGALDVVFVHSEDPGDVAMAESVHAAGRRGASMLITAPDEGPLAAAAAGYGVLLAPRVPVPPGFGFPRVLAAGLWLLDALGMRTADLAGLAAALDVEAAGSQPAKESFVNPAKSVALRLADRTPLLWGLDPVATAATRCAALSFAAYAGVVCDAESYDAALGMPALRLLAQRATQGAGIFEDPYGDQEGDPDGWCAGGTPVRLVLLGALPGREVDARRAAAEDRFAGVDVQAMHEELVDSGADAAVCAAVLGLRFELAALYSGFASDAFGRDGSPRSDVFASAGR